jgi:hypothetical protein
LRKEILLVLIDTTEPVVVGDSFDTRYTQNFVAVGKRYGIDDGSAVNYDESIGSSNICSSTKRVFNDRQKREEEKGDSERTERQKQPDFLAKQICKYNAREFHAKLPAGAA